MAMISQSRSEDSDSAVLDRKNGIYEMALLKFEKCLPFLKENLNSQIGANFIDPMKGFISCRHGLSNCNENECLTQQRSLLSFLSKVGSHLPHDMKDINGIPLAAFITLAYSSLAIVDPTYCSKELVQQANELCKEEPLSASLLILAVLFSFDSFSLFKNALSTIISAGIDLNETFPYNNVNKLCIDYFAGTTEIPQLLLGDEQSALSVAIACRYDNEAILLLMDGISSSIVHKVSCETHSANLSEYCVPSNII